VTGHTPTVRAPTAGRSDNHGAGLAAGHQVDRPTWQSRREVRDTQENHSGFCAHIRPKPFPRARGTTYTNKSISAWRSTSTSQPDSLREPWEVLMVWNKAATIVVGIVAQDSSTP